MPATHNDHPTTAASPTLYLAFELGWTSWKLAFTDAPARPPPLVTIPARDLDALQRQISRAHRGQPPRPPRQERRPRRGQAPGDAPAAPRRRMRPLGRRPRAQPRGRG